MKKNDLLGWIGVTLILTGYGLLTLDVLTSHSVLYGLINLLGALGLIVSSYAKKDLQPVALNLVWLLIAIIGITKSLFA